MLDIFLFRKESICNSVCKDFFPSIDVFFFGFKTSSFWHKKVSVFVSYLGGGGGGMYVVEKVYFLRRKGMFSE